MMDSKEQGQSKAQETRVDLGEDLLAQALQKKGTTAQLSLVEMIQNAEILISEGLFDEAKRLLRKVLIQDANHSLARKMQENLQELELKKIFSDSENEKTESEQEEDDIEAIIQKLSHDLHLEDLSLFQDQEEIQNFCCSLEKKLSCELPQAWVDLGIAFLEMELYSISVRLFAGACQRGEQSAVPLLACALLAVGKPLQALSEIQPLLKDLEIPKAQKIELYYWMGRCYEKIGKTALGVQYYQFIFETEPNYRDVERRLKKC